MTARRALIRALDHGSGRKVLGALATWYARKLTGRDVSIFYDAGWIHRLGSDYIPDGLRFDYYENTIRNWPAKHQAICANAVDHWFHVYRPKPGDVIVDVGAGIGLETPVVSHAVGPTGRVLAIEAHPTTFRRLQTACKWNRLSNVTAAQYAIMDRRCTVTIEDGDHHEANAVGAAQLSSRPHLAVPAIPLDELCACHDITCIDFLKMNIEGAERFAIEGMRQLIRRTRYLCIACHDFRGPGFRTRDLVIDFLRQNDFEIVTRDEDPRDFVRDHVHGINPAEPVSPKTHARIPRKNLFIQR